MVTVETVAVGNELLIGDTLDTNTNWVCKRITGIGGQVERAVLVRDKLDAIAREVKSALERKTDVIFTMGGMGPTSDDMTLEAIAKATNRPLELNAEALAFVKEKYEELARKGYVDDASMTPSREKMAILPNGAIPLDNPVGAAPAVVLRTESSSIVICLPGVPAELKGIFEGSLQPILKEIFGESIFLEKAAIVNSKDESILAPILKAVSDKNPGVYIKSRPKRFGPDVKIRVTLSIAGSSKEDVEQQIERTLQDLRQALNDAGISIDSTEE